MKFDEQQELAIQSFRDNFFKIHEIPSDRKRTIRTLDMAYGYFIGLGYNFDDGTQMAAKCILGMGIKIAESESDFLDKNE